MLLPRLIIAVRVKLTRVSEKFTQAIGIEPENHILYSNRSAVYASQHEYQKALEDAEKSISIKPDWAKGQLRKGAAYRGLGDLCKSQDYRLGVICGHIADSW